MEQLSKTTPLHVVIDHFRDEMRKGFEHLARAAEVYVQALDCHADAREQFAAALPQITITFWRRLERVGRKSLHARLLYYDIGISQRHIERLPYSQQREALDRGVEVFVTENDHLLVRVEDLTSWQTKQVFADDHIRTLPEQRAWLESQRAVDANKTRGKKRPYRIAKHGQTPVIIIDEPVTFTGRDLRRLLERLDAAAAGEKE